MTNDRGMVNGISADIRRKITFINKVGVSKIIKHCERFYPARNINNALRIIRSIAQVGYTETANRFGISKQCAHQLLKEYYRVAKEVEFLACPETTTDCDTSPILCRGCHTHTQDGGAA